MPSNNHFEVIIIGGSYAGLSAAMALGRSLRNVLVIDSGKPCNQQTPHSHNFITQDGETPAAIAEKARKQVASYNTIQWYNGRATEGRTREKGFEISTEEGEAFTAEKLLFATGVTDVMPVIKGFAECWGISVLHCPYCHGYEVKHQPIGLIGNGDMGFEFCRLISHWTNQLTLFTNGRSMLTEKQAEKLKSHRIEVVEKEILAFAHAKGSIHLVVFTDHSTKEVSAIFARAGFNQHCDIPQRLGCNLTDQGYIRVDDFYRTSVRGIYAAGDNTSVFRSVAGAVAAGNKAGALINKELIEEAF